MTSFEERGAAEVAARGTHVAYADEAGHNVGRYRSVAAVTLGVTDAERATRDLRRLLDQASIKEFKWAKLRTARDRFAALKMADYVLGMVASRALRVDVIIWDTHDSRHAVRNRNDVRNLRRMYYFLLANALGRRWPRECVCGRSSRR